MKHHAALRSPCAHGGDTGEPFDTHLKVGLAKWARVVKHFGIRVD